jgi:adenylate cyclase 2
MENLLKIEGNKQAENGGLYNDENISRNRSPSKMTKYIECWGADKPFANITESTMAKNIGLAVSTIKFTILIHR